MTKVCFIVITRNRRNKLEKCLNSIYSNTENTPVVVVDNGSDDTTKDILEADTRIKILHLRQNIGVAPARNVGLNYAKNNYNPAYFVFLDDDAYLEKFPTEEIEKIFENQDIGIIAPFILYPDGEIQESLRAFPSIKALLWRGFRLYKLYRPKFYKKYIDPPRTKYHPVEWAIGACLIIRKEVFERSGFFDEGYFFGYEDADLCRRALEKGFKTIYNPEIVIKHEYMRTSAKLLNISTLRHIASIIRFLFT